MKRLLIILIASLCYVSLSAQDLIVTSQNDSLNCKVTKVDQDNIYFTSNGQTSILPLIKVKACLYNFFKQKQPVTNIDKPLEEEPAPETSSMPEESNYKRFRFALSGGAGYRTYGISDGLATNLKNYYYKLKTGYCLEGDASYFYSSRRGVGLKLSVYKASNSIDNVCIITNGFLNEGKVADDVTVLFAGPSFSTRMNNMGSRNSFYLSAAVGYTYYKDKRICITSYDDTGSTMGFSLDLGYDFAISDYLALGIQASFFSGSVSKINETDHSAGTTSTYYYNENITRMDLGIGLRF